ncbi:ribonuclease P protein component [Sporichthya sp.]|uniref:ribonuclease P protein component n=1 Tax=Sporichthya sp. TaxID=65475 RepID=UPI001821CBCF|nr:ribonuclease P protein component [Sporichthya sp.]MBA3741689.1 ribonuclease P protein component [Sporichthya sp.]
MLPAGNRLRRAPDFAAAVRGGRRSGRNSLVLHLRTGPCAAGSTADPTGVSAGQGPAQVGLVVGKSVGPAVVRNQVKRRLRAVLRTRLDRLPAGSVLVVRALPPAGTARSVALAADVDAGLARLLPEGAR